MLMNAAPYLVFVSNYYNRHSSRLQLKDKVLHFIVTTSIQVFSWSTWWLMGVITLLVP